MSLIKEKLALCRSKVDACAKAERVPELELELEEEEDEND